MKRAFDELLLGNLLTPLLALVLGTIFGLLVFVLARGVMGMTNLLPYAVAGVAGLIIAGGINALLKVPKHTDWH